MKKYIKAPLPFQGQKRNMLKNFAVALNEFKDKNLFIDAFGGSGLLSHTIKFLRPDAKVIYNDFDGYSDRLKHIDETNELLGQINDLINDCVVSKRISSAHKEQILTLIENFKGYKDYLAISSQLLFSGRYAHSFNELKKNGFYKQIRNFTPYNCNGYLQDVDIVSKDGFELMKEYKDKGAVLVLDPPYLQTYANGYKNGFKLRDFLKLIDNLGQNYILFSSDKSDILEFFDYLQNNPNFSQYKDYRVLKGKLSQNIKNKDDYLIYKSS